MLEPLQRRIGLAAAERDPGIGPVMLSLTITSVFGKPFIQLFPGFSSEVFARGADGLEHFAVGRVLSAERRESLCAGAVVYGRKRPNPSPAWFGFHEIFHAGTVAGFVSHYVAISLLTYAAR